MFEVNVGPRLIEDNDLDILSLWHKEDYDPSIRTTNGNHHLLIEIVI